MSSLLAAAIWTNSAGGFWRDATNWSANRAPFLGSGSTYLTNAGVKTVVIDAATPLTNLFVNGLNLWAPTNSTNTLLLQDVGTNSPLVVSNQTFTINNRGALQITNASLMVTGRFISFNIQAGEITLDSGLLVIREEPPTTNVTVITRLGRTNTATLNVNGGEMHVTQLLAGETANPGVLRSRGNINLTGGRLTISGEFSVGDGISCTGIVNMTGGEIRALDQGTNTTRIGDHGRGELTVSNALFQVGNMSVARHTNSFGVIRLLDGGFLRAGDDLSIGRFGGSTGFVYLAGGTLLNTNNEVWVGREGRGQLLVSNGMLLAEGLNVAVPASNTAFGALTLAGGTTVLSSNLLVGNTVFTNASVLMTGGNLVITNASRDAHANVVSGTMTVTGGDVTLDELRLTNGTGRLYFHGGVVRSRRTVVRHGSPFTVGDGVTPTEFILEGGVHEFADGLIISPNAIVSGCGTILGPIVNNGTLLATNCPGGPAITVQPVSALGAPGGTASLAVTATGDGPLSYQWRRGLPAAGATNIPGATSATLTLTNLSAADAGDYHVLVSNPAGGVLSSNATLTVLGDISLQMTLENGNACVFRFTSLIGRSYTVEFKDSLNDLLWDSLPSLPGTGGLLSITNVVTNSPTRFYRLRID